MQTQHPLRRLPWVSVLSLLLAGSLLLAACGGSTSESEPEQEAAAPTSTEQQAEAVAQADTPEPTTAPVESEATEAPADMPTDEAHQSLTNPTCSSIQIDDDATTLPAVAGEWAQGPENAAITVVEYGDFQ